MFAHRHRGQADAGIQGKHTGREGAYEQRGAGVHSDQDIGQGGIYERGQPPRFRSWAAITGSKKEGKNALEIEIEAERDSENVQDELIVRLFKNTDVKKEDRGCTISASRKT